MKNSDTLFEQVQAAQCKKYGITSCIMDGILYPENFEKSPFKIVFILKEPYADWDAVNNKPISEDFNFSDIVHNLKAEYDRGLNKTWLKVASIAYSLKNNSPYTENLSYVQIVEGLKCVCWINLSKTPWKTTSNIHDPEFLERIKTWDPVVKAQLEEASKIGIDMVWYGDTWDLGPINPVEPDIDWDENHDAFAEKWYHRTTQGGQNNKIMLAKYEKTSVILINGYHPGYGNSVEWTIDCIKDYKTYF